MQRQKTNNEKLLRRRDSSDHAASIYRLRASSRILILLNMVAIAKTPSLKELEETVNQQIVVQVILYCTKSHLGLQEAKANKFYRILLKIPTNIPKLLLGFHFRSISFHYSLCVY